MSVQKSNGLTKAENMISDITSMILFLIHGDVLFPLAIGAAIDTLQEIILVLSSLKRKALLRPVLL